MKIDIEIWFSPSCSFLCDSAYFIEMQYGCKFKNEEMAAIFKIKKL